VVRSLKFIADGVLAMSYSAFIETTCLCWTVIET